jgi:hypothetical protein
MVTYSVNMDNVQEVAAQMGAIAAYMKEMLDDLNTQLAASLSDWSAVSQELGYAPCQTNWNNAVENMTHQANIAQGQLGKIMDAYANAEYQGLGLWG